MKLKDNKDHHIDKLFAEKLSQLEQSPSENAWQTLEKRLGQKAVKKNKGFIWIPYATAAAIALLILSIWLLKYQTSSSAENPTIAQHEPTTHKKFSKKQDSLTDTHATNQSIDAIQKELPVKPEQAVAQIDTKQAHVHKQPVVAHNRNKPSSKNVKKQQIEEIGKPVIEPVEKTLASLETERTAIITPSSLTTDQTTTIVVQVELEEENTESLEEIEEASNEIEEPVQKQKSKASRLLNTLRKLKKAEFDELGIHPETIVAYVKDKATSNNHSTNK